MSFRFAFFHFSPILRFAAIVIQIRFIDAAIFFAIIFRVFEATTLSRHGFHYFFAAELSIIAFMPHSSAAAHFAAS